MTYHGQIKNGMIVLEQPVDLPEGSCVRVDIRPLGPASKGTLSERLLRRAGRAEDLPPDASRNLDHYLYGHPKT
jgi:hypothetical protein